MSCGFAHSLQELELVDKPSCYGIDSSCHRCGKSDVDFFYGQCYSASQLLRVLMYVTQASHLPSWARMVLWYYRILPPSAFALDFDFVWPVAVAYVAHICLHSDVSSDDAYGLCKYEWPASFLAADFCGRVISRLASEQVLPVFNMKVSDVEPERAYALLYFRGERPRCWYMVPCEDLGNSGSAEWLDPDFSVSPGEAIRVHELGGPRGFGEQFWPLPQFAGEGVVYMA